MTGPIITASGVAKRYLGLDNPTSRFRLLVAPKAHYPVDSSWALQPCDVHINRGESVGIVGRNGSGKSTLLSILAGVMTPTLGTIERHGRVSAILELGSGFNPDFTGRENVYFNGRLHGFSKQELDERVDSIAAFAEIGTFFDRPVRTYSSGMYVRLAFAIAISIDPDLLIVDEALSVGDVFFQQKCFERLRELRSGGTSLVFVSHDSGAIYRFCDRAILLERGVVVQEGLPKAIISAYESTVIAARDETLAQEDANDYVVNQNSALSNPAIVVTDDEAAASEPDSIIHEINRQDEVTVDVFDIIDENGITAPAFTSESNISIRVRLTFHRDINDPHVGFKIRNRFGEVVFETNTYCMRSAIGPVRAGKSVEVHFSFKAPLHAADYTLNLGIAEDAFGDNLFRRQILYRNDLFPFKVLFNDEAIFWSGVVNLAPRLTVSHPEADAVEPESHGSFP